jgi:hypothetical protein
LPDEKAGGRSPGPSLKKDSRYRFRTRPGLSAGGSEDNRNKTWAARIFYLLIYQSIGYHLEYGRFTGKQGLVGMDYAENTCGEVE